MLHKNSIRRRHKGQSQGLTNIIFAAVQDCLITPDVLTDIRERLDNSQSQLLPLLLLIHRNVLNVPHASQAPQELAFDENTADSNDLVGPLVYYDDWVVCARGGTHGIELRDPGSFSGIGDDC